MRYKKVIINNFRGIKSFTLENTARVNLLLGKNNCGKSSILEAIFLITGINNPQLILNIDSLRNLAHTEEGDFRFPFYNLDYNFPPKIETDGLDRKKVYKMEILPKIVVNEVIVPSKDKSDQPISESITSTHTNPLEVINGLEIKCEIKEEGKQPIRFTNSIELKRAQNNFPIFQPKLNPNYKQDYVAIIQSPRSQTPLDIFNKLGKMIIEKEKAILIEQLKGIDEKIVDVSLGPNNMIYVDIGIEKSLIPLNLMGDGLIKYLDILVDLNATTNGILLIDEIDNGLHYSTLEKIWKAIITVADSNNVQLFITTHSKETLISLKKVLGDESMVKFRDEVKSYTLNRQSDGKVYNYEYDYEAFNFALENDIEIRGEI